MSIYTMGIDIGSTTSKCVILKDGEEIVANSLYTGGIGTPSPDRARAEALIVSGLKQEELAASAATGYGRNRVENVDYNVSELSCHALGAHMIFPDVRTIIDIGGQDAKVISLSENGKMKDFLMNDKCAAGTGRFLDVMANVLQIPVDSMAQQAAEAAVPAQISSTCTVFAESEVISQLANGTPMAGHSGGNLRVGRLTHRVACQAYPNRAGGDHERRRRTERSRAQCTGPASGRRDPLLEAGADVRRHRRCAVRLREAGLNNRPEW